MPDALREQLNHYDAGDDQTHAEHGRQVQALLVEKHRGDAHQDDAQARPYRVSDANRDTRLSIQNEMA